jgi:glycosyltransferase involved in cell wall biosynthesis
LPEPRGLRVLVVAHNAVAESNRQRVEELARLPGTQVWLLTPGWWFEEGRLVRVDASAWWSVGRTLATGNGTRYVYLSHLVGLIRRLRPDVIDVHEEPFSLAAAQVVLAREALASRAAVAFYSAVNLVRRWRLPYRLAERLVLARGDAAYGPNRDVPEVLRAKGFSGPVATIPLGVDVDRFARASATELGIDRPRIGFLGRLEPVKGLPVLLDAMARLRVPATLVIGGEGPERERLRGLVQAAGLGKRVSFVGEVAYADVPGFLKALDVLVLPSVTLPPEHKEQFGRVLIEAMAAGVAVVGSSSGAIPEVIGEAGLVVPEADPTALATALERVLTDAGLRAGLVERGRARVVGQYAWPVVAARTRELYERAVVHRLERRAGAPTAVEAVGGR